MKFINKYFHQKQAVRTHQINKANKIALPVLILCLVIFAAIVIAFINMSYPRVGHDYSILIPAIIDNALYYRLNGLSIEWYTPSFGGGIPVYPDPVYATFSILVFLAIILPPWSAVIVSTVIYILIGGVLCYYFFKKVLGLHWTSSILGTLFFIATGFYLQRIAVGHYFQQAFPLLAIFFIALFDTSFPKWVAGAVVALTTAYLIYSNGNFALLIFGLSLLLTCPLIYIYRPGLFSFRRIAIVLAAGGAMALLLSASKFGAVYSFMRYFSRTIADDYHVGFFQGISGIFLQLFGTMILAPFVKLIGGHPSLLDAYMQTVTGAPYGIWEMDISLSPVVFGILFIGTAGVLTKVKEYKKWFFLERRWIAWILLGLATWMTVEFILAKGLIYPLLQKLPILNSLHVNPRFTASLIFPLAFLAAIFINRWVVRWSVRKSIAVFFILTILTFIPFGVYFMISGDLQSRIYNITPSNTIDAQIRAGDPMTITEIASGLSNTQALLQHKSNLEPYDPIFGYNLEYFHPEIHPGSVWELSGGYYNMTNPSGYVFPEVNDTRAFERITEGDEENLGLFINHKATKWNLPTYQKVFNWASSVTFGVILLSLLVSLFLKKVIVKSPVKRE